MGNIIWVLLFLAVVGISVQTFMQEGGGAHVQHLCWKEKEEWKEKKANQNIPSPRQGQKRHSVHSGRLSLYALGQDFLYGEKILGELLDTLYGKQEFMTALQRQYPHPAQEMARQIIRLYEQEKLPSRRVEAFAQCSLVEKNLQKALYCMIEGAEGVQSTRLHSYGRYPSLRRYLSLDQRVEVNLYNAPVELLTVLVGESTAFQLCCVREEIYQKAQGAEEEWRARLHTEYTQRVLSVLQGAPIVKELCGVALPPQIRWPPPQKFVDVYGE